ncbi:MAG: NUDIX domain-containing protein [Pseudomonadota bacterium]|nr:NUDIX domain-containing protein [Pseudomonadota bacterium]
MIPKGNVDFKSSPHAAAAQEAEEEAGVRGKISAKPIGRFIYQKRAAGGRAVTAKVIVFPLAVSEELKDWKEKAERERRWFSLAKAAAAVDEPDLSALIRSFRPNKTN